MLDKMKDLIRSQDMCVLATVAENRPHCSLMAYVADDTCREIYMVTHRNTAKFRNAVANPYVSLLIDTRVEHRGKDRGRAQALTVTGLFERFANPERRDGIRDWLLDRHAHLREFAAHPEAEVFLVRVQSLQLLDGLTDAYYESIT